MGEGKRECHPGRISRAFLPACTACVFLVFSLTRFINIGRSLWTDEASQVLDSMRPFSEVAFAAARQTMMPLDFWIIHFAVDVFGQNAFAYRFSSLLFSHLTALIVFLFVKRICRSPWPALLAVLILSCNRLYLMFSQEVRPYSLTVFFVLWIYYIGYSFYRKPRFRDFLALLVCTSLGFMGHGFFVFSFPGLFVAGLLVGFSALFARRRSWRFRMRRCGMVLLPLCVALISFLLARPALRRLLLFAEDVGYLKSMPAKRSLAERVQHLQENIGFDGMWSCVLGYMSPVVPSSRLRSPV